MANYPALNIIFLLSIAKFCKNLVGDSEVTAPCLRGPSLCPPLLLGLTTNPLIKT